MPAHSSWSHCTSNDIHTLVLIINLPTHSAKYHCWIISIIYQILSSDLDLPTLSAGIIELPGVTYDYRTCLFRGFPTRNITNFIQCSMQQWQQAHIILCIIYQKIICTIAVLHPPHNQTHLRLTIMQCR